MLDRYPSPVPGQVPVSINGDSQVFHFEVPYTMTEVDHAQSDEEVLTVISLQPTLTDLPTDVNLPTVPSLQMLSSSSEPVASVPQLSEETLLKAIAASIDTTSLTPLIKEELKYTIQSRRQAQGKQQLKVRFDIPEKSELSDEEKLKVKKRREQNKIAAQRFRDKQKSIGSKLIKKIHNLESRNTLLMTDVKVLKEERDELVRRVRKHISVCPYIRLDT